VYFVYVETTTSWNSGSFGAHDIFQGSSLMCRMCKLRNSFCWNCTVELIHSLYLKILSLYQIKDKAGVCFLNLQK